MEKKICGIYCIENLVNGKKYIGQSVDIIHRFYEHRSDLNSNKHYNAHLQSAWNLYGRENFSFSTIEECPLSMLDEKEKYYIKLFDTKSPEHGYNRNSGGKNITEQSREKLASAARKSIWTDERREKLSKKMSGENSPMYGKHHTEETKQKMRENRKDSSGVNNSMYGKHHTVETKKKISQSKKGQIPPETALEKNRQRTAENNPRHRPIYCPELDRAFWGPTEVEQEGITKQSYVSAVLRGRQKTAGKHPITGEPLHWTDVNHCNQNGSI